MPNIDVNFTEVDSPTAKQVDFVQEICRVLHIDKPKEYTRNAYSDFISNNVEEFKDELYLNDEGRRLYDW